MSDFDITKKLAERIEMLEATYKEYINLLQMLDVFVEQGVFEDKVTITVVKKDMVLGKTWKEIITEQVNRNKIIEEKKEQIFLE
jgi:hypothetical protein